MGQGGGRDLIGQGVTNSDVRNGEQRLEVEAEAGRNIAAAQAREDRRDWVTRSRGGADVSRVRIVGQPCDDVVGVKPGGLTDLDAVTVRTRKDGVE